MSLDKQVLAETKAALDKYDGNQSRAAAALGVARSTIQSRIAAMSRDGYSVPEKAQISHEVELRDRVRSLESVIAGHNRDNLDAHYVKREIFKLAESEPKTPGWMLRPHKKGSSSGVPTLFASDLHWGEEVRPEEIGGVNEYNMKIANERFRTLIEKAVYLLTEHVVNPNYPGIVFALGGDNVSGDIHEELSNTNEQPIMPVLLDLWGVLAWAIAILVEKFGRVFIPAVPGNHSRTNKKPNAKRRHWTSYDWLLYQMLAKRFEGCPEVTFFIPDGPDALYSVYGHRYLLSHGDQFKGGDGLIGCLGPIIRGDHRKRSRNAQINMGYDTAMLAHFHQLIQLKRMIVNGSLKGYDEYAYRESFGFEPAQQGMWITHPEHGIIHSMPVLVQRTEIKKAGEWISWKQG